MSSRWASFESPRNRLKIVQSAEKFENLTTTNSSAIFGRVTQMQVLEV